MTLKKNYDGIIPNSFFIGLINPVELKNNGGVLEIQNIVKLGAVANYSKFEADGTLEFNGDATVWTDIFFSISRARIPTSSAPTWAVFTTNIKKYTFAVNDYVYVGSSELAHTYKEGSNLYPHIHIYTNGVDVTDRTVKYKSNNIMCGVGAAAVEANFEKQFTIPANTPDKTHLLLQFDAVSGVGKTIGGDICARFSRVVEDTGTAPSNDPFVSQLGIHIEQDTMGSRDIIEK